METRKLIIIGLLFATSIHAKQYPYKNITRINVQSDKHTYQYILNYDSQNRITTAIPDNSETFGITNFQYGKHIPCQKRRPGYFLLTQ